MKPLMKPAVMILLAIIVTVAFAACSPSQLQFTKTTASVGVAELKGIRNKVSILVSQGKASQKDLDVLDKAIKAADPVNGQIQGLTEWPPADKQALFDKLSEFSTTMDGILAEAGVLPQVSEALSIASAVFSGLAASIGPPKISRRSKPVDIPASQARLKAIHKELSQLAGN